MIVDDVEMAAWFVYIVRCRDGSLYTGISTNVAARLQAHNGGRGARYTRSRRPVMLVHIERRRSRSTALRREAAIKAMARPGKLDLISRPVAPPNRRAKVSDAKVRGALVQR